MFLGVHALCGTARFFLLAPRLFAGSRSSSLAGRFLPLGLRRRIRGGFLTLGIEQVGDLLLFNLGLTVVCLLYTSPSPRD